MSKRILTQTSDGELTLGDKGEKLVDHYSFYASFMTPEEYRLVAGSKAIGAMPVSQPVPVGSYLIFAGRRWQVDNVDETARVIGLKPASGGRAPRFDGGGFDVHDRVRAEMRRFYSRGEETAFSALWLSNSRPWSSRHQSKALQSACGEQALWRLPRA